MNKKAVIDITLTPILYAALILAFAIPMGNAIYQIGTSRAFDEKSYAIKNGLVREGLQAMPKDTNAKVEVTVPQDFGFEFDKHTTRAYYKSGQGYTYYNTHTPAYRMIPASFNPTASNSPLLHYKNGNVIGIASLGQNPQFSLNTLIPYCEPPPPNKKLKATFDKKAILNYGSTPVQLASGEVNIKARTGSATKPLLKIYVSNKEGAHIACHIIQKILADFPTIEGAAPIPVNTQLLPKTDERSQLTGTSLLIELSGINLDTPKDKSKFAEAVYEGVKEYGLA